MALRRANEKNVGDAFWKKVYEDIDKQDEQTWTGGMKMPVLLESNSPRICREDFDKEAVEFLEKYYPEALQRPMAVPILDVARNRMGLRVVKARLTEDFSILGQMCFTNV